MASSGNNHGLVLAFLIVVSSASTAFSVDFDTAVRIENKLPGRASFKVHCRSKDDDLGTRVIPHGRYYQFVFIPNLWGNTLFFCRVSWRGGTISFDAYRQWGKTTPYQFADNRCKHICKWHVTQTGVVGYAEYRHENYGLGKGEVYYYTYERDFFYPFKKT